MPSAAASIKIELINNADQERGRALMHFFKTGPGEYGEGDRFLGLRVPFIRSIVKRYRTRATLADTEKLLDSPWHEIRFAGATLLTYLYEKGDRAMRQRVYRTFTRHRGINNWDLIDVHTPKIVGTHLAGKTITPLKKLATSASVWKRRIAVVGAGSLLREGRIEPTFEICEILMNDRHDLIHKACGWMLREAGKRNRKALEMFLVKHRSHMPRTMVRYAIEKFPEANRKTYLLQGATRHPRHTSEVDKRFGG